jgi:hypothetical protein
MLALAMVTRSNMGRRRGGGVRLGVYLYDLGGYDTMVYHG